MSPNPVKGLLAAGLLAMAGVVHGAVVTWDGDAGDGFWTNALNWSSNALPVAADNIFITNGNSVILPNGNLPNACTVTVSGASTLNATAGVVRLLGSTINVSSGTLAGGWWDLNNGTLKFEDGAAATMSTVEHRGKNTFGFKFSPTGFKTLTPGQIRFASTVWSNMAYSIDASSYVVTNGYSVVLVDYSSFGDTAYTNAFIPAVNIITNIGSPAASLSFNTATLQLILNYVAPPTPPKTWDGGGGDNSWTTPANWNPDGAPLASDKVLVGAGASVTNGQNAFASLMIDSGAAVKFAVNTAAGNVITNAGILNFPGVWRLNGAPVVTLTGSGSLGSEISWLDTQGARVNFQDGASIANGNMSLELRNNTKFGFTLSSSGFSTLDFGQIWDGGTAWSNIAFYLDLSSFNWSNGTTVVLADFNSHTAPLGGVFNPTVNIVATNGLGGALSFDTVNSSLVLTLDPPGNDPPVALSQTVSIITNQPVNITLTGFDPEGSNLTFSIVSQPTKGSLSGVAPNLTYTPTSGVAVLDSFAFTAFDGQAFSSNTGKVTIAYIPNTAGELWSMYHPAILADPLNVEWLTNWTDSGISFWQIRYDLGPLTGTRTNVSPKIAAFYAFPIGGTNLPGLVQIHGGGQRAEIAEAKYWAQQGYAAISINWGGLPLIAGVPNTDWDGLPAGFLRDGVTNALHHEWTDPDVYIDGATLFDVLHPLNSSWMLNSYAARRALTFLQARTNVNSTKLGVTGHSMGGQTTVLTATDPRITCITPSVGGAGFRYEDQWGLPGSKLSTNGTVDVDFYTRTVDAQSYWPDIACPTLFLTGANDYNAPFDLVVKSMALQPTNVEQRLAVAPHLNHRFDTESYAARVLWQKAHLTGNFSFPKTSAAQLELAQSNGIPRFKVWPDTSTTNAIVGVDIYYGIERDPLIRFWRDAKAVQTNGHWEAPSPVYDVNEMVAAMAVVTYDCGFYLPMPAGYDPSTRVFSVVSEVSLVYPPDLANNGVQATEVKERLIDDFARGFHDWFLLNEGNPQVWQFWTRKVTDPSWRGPTGANLSFSVSTASPGNTLGVKLLVDWNESPANTYVAFVSLPSAGTTAISLPVNAFTNQGSGMAMTNWSNVKQLGLMPGNIINAGFPVWSGGTPSFSNLNWAGGNYQPGEEFARWNAAFGLRGTNAVANFDYEADGNVNLFEYAVGGSPVSGGDGALLPTIGNRPGVPFQGLEYAYLRRRDAAIRGLTYTVQSSSNLVQVPSAWSTNGTSEVGAGIIDVDFERVTNRIIGGSTTFGRLEVKMIN